MWDVIFNSNSVRILLVASFYCQIKIVIGARINYGKSPIEKKHDDVNKTNGIFHADFSMQRWYDFNHRI